MGISGRKTSDELEELICERYRKGDLLADIANKSRISQATVMAILRRYNVPLRNGKRLSHEQESMVVGLYKAGESIAQIKVESGVKSEQTIYRILRDAGVERRKKRKAAE